MKIKKLMANLKRKLTAAVRSAGMAGKILFLLCCLSGLFWIVSSFSVIGLALFGLCGVMWLSSIALHMVRNGMTRSFNPFTALVILCVATTIGCTLWTSMFQPTLNEDREPINVLYRNLASAMESLTEEEEVNNRMLAAFKQFPEVMNGTESNLILTDSQNQIIYQTSTWIIGSEETSVRMLVGPYCSSFGGDRLMLLVNEQGDALAAFIAESEYMQDSMLSLSNSLTIRSDAEPEAEQPRDEIFETYFPSFGTNIDLAACDLACNGIWIDAGDGEDGITHINIAQWKGERVREVASNTYNDALIAQELNALTKAEREELIDYLTWLRRARNSAYDVQEGKGGLSEPLYARVLTGGDGKTTLMMLYQERDSVTRTQYAQYNWAYNRNNFLSMLGMLNIPAAIVFLAFWVFVDAKRRGQSSPALWATLTLLGNVVAWVVYMLVRPSMTTGASGQQMPRGACPICGTKLKSDFIACPGCGILLRNRCKNCGCALENDWSFCPYCTSAVVHELPASDKGEA